MGSCTLLDFLSRLTKHAPQLYALYIEPRNRGLAQRLYIAPCSSSPLVRATISRQLRSAAQTELVKSTSSTSSIIDVGELYREAQRAWDALETLLGERDTWFFGAEQPSLFDASVFAYSHLLLGGVLGWDDQRLVMTLRGKTNLERHHQRILDDFYSGHA